MIIIVVVVIIIITTITQIGKFNFFYIPYFNLTYMWWCSGTNVFMVSNKHIDGNHKLIQPYKIIIHGGLDGFSRMIVFL